MGEQKKPAGKVEKVVRRIVLGPESERGTEPRDARAITDEQSGGGK